jgi:hypothetical protein
MGFDGIEGIVRDAIFTLGREVIEDCAVEPGVSVCGAVCRKVLQ